MIRSRMRQHADRVRAELQKAFVEEHTPRQVAGSFALGTFITMLPTLGTGLVLFLVISYLFGSVSKLALFASVVVFNPVVKWGVYASSIALGVFILGPIEVATLADSSVDAGQALGTRLLVGNLILAIVATVAGYVVVHRLTVGYRTTELGTRIDDVVEEFIDESIDA